MSAAKEPRLLVSPSPEEWVLDAARWISERLAAALSDRPRASMSLAGGSTPAAVYRQLVEGGEGWPTVDWSRIDLYLGDERAVEPDHPDANARLAMETLVQPLGRSAPQLFLPVGIAHSVEAAADAYDELVPDVLDLCLLGIGEDGHVASLFPGQPTLEEMSRKVVPVHDSPKPPPDRISLTPRVLADARALAVLARGEGKQEPVRLALAVEGPASELPARLARHGTWLLDAAAAPSA